MFDSPERFLLATLVVKTSQNLFPARGDSEVVSSGHLPDCFPARMELALVLVTSEKTAMKTVRLARAVFRSLSSEPLPR